MPVTPRPAAPEPHCHWAHIHGDRQRTDASSAVWICEDPYPSMRTDGPDEECDGCPVWDAMVKARAAADRAREHLLIATGTSLRS